MRLGLEFFDIDLRGGVPEHDADRERANFWTYCKQWIECVDPFLLCMLGERYGWAPPPEEIRDPADRTTYAGLSIIEMEVRYAVFDKKLRRSSLFYVRGTATPRTVPPEVFATFVDVSGQARLAYLKQYILAIGRPVHERFDHPGSAVTVTARSLQHLPSSMHKQQAQPVCQEVRQ